MLYTVKEYVPISMILVMGLNRYVSLYGTVSSLSYCSCFRATCFLSTFVYVESYISFIFSFKVRRVKISLLFTFSASRKLPNSLKFTWVFKDTDDFPPKPKLYVWLFSHKLFV